MIIYCECTTNWFYVPNGEQYVVTSGGGLYHLLTKGKKETQQESWE